MQTIWGIDLGGTKIEGVVLTPDFKVLARRRIPTEKQFGYQHIISQIVKLVRLLEEETGHQPTTIGIGTPGTLTPSTQTMKNSNTTCLNGQPLKADLIKALKMPLEMANDANCFALAETRMGIIPDKMPDAKVVFGVIMGTGAGGGVVVNNQIIGGRHGIGGEWGHNLLEENGNPCYCGKAGCVEQVIAGPSLQAYYTSISGETRTFKEIVERYKAGIDMHATQTVERLFAMFGKAISVIINILDPDAIVIGGGVGNFDELYTKGVAAIQPHIFNDKVETVFLKPKLGDSAGVFGAAMLVT